MKQIDCTQRWGWARWSEGPLGERNVMVALTKNTFQLYQPTMYGFEPEDLTLDICDWKMNTEIEDFDLISDTSYSVQYI